MTPQVSVHILVDGTVQGVGFRYFIKHSAEELGVTGWVRNRYDDRVEILAQGEEKDLQKLVALARIGPPASMVTELDVEWSKPVVIFSRFSIVSSA